MPNYCHNVLSVVGSDTSWLDAYTSFYKPPFQRGQTPYLDFEKILPMPAAIDMNEVVTVTAPDGRPTDPIWYTWRMKHWGTKWGAMDCLLEQATFSFLTAWTPPRPIVRELALLTNRPLMLSYSEPEMGFDGDFIAYPDGAEYNDHRKFPLDH